MIRKILAITLFVATNVNATETKTPNMYVEEAARAGVDHCLLYAIALQESKAKINNGSVMPWPWSLNHLSLIHI